MCIRDRRLRRPAPEALFGGVQAVDPPEKERNALKAVLSLSFSQSDCDFLLWPRHPGAMPDPTRR
eukprot:5188360-Alexandrium_andersonii.AAC.1